LELQQKTEQMFIANQALQSQIEQQQLYIYSYIYIYRRLVFLIQPENCVVRAGEAKLREAARRRCFRSWGFFFPDVLWLHVPIDPVFGASVRLTWVFMRMFN